jgi:hypothetical protein
MAFLHFLNVIQVKIFELGVERNMHYMNYLPAKTLWATAEARALKYVANAIGWRGSPGDISNKDKHCCGRLCTDPIPGMFLIVHPN